MIDAVVAGHLCLDILPDMTAHAADRFDLSFRPGRLINVGKAYFSTGGAVSNTGLALDRLGVRTRLCARVGRDRFGEAILQIVKEHSPGLERGIVSRPGSSTSYTIVISPPGSDRRFLHHSGANDEFGAEDVKDRDLRGARLFHFGYPPVMARMFAGNGAQLTEMFRRAKSLGLTTSLDMTFPDPGSPGGKADWRAILRNTLPFVDVFLPSLDEILFMLGRAADVPISRRLLSEVGGELLGMGAKMAVLKLGGRGLYIRVGVVDAKDLGRARPSNPTAWAGYESWLPCFDVDVVGTNGAGDATIAGFLAALLRDLPPEEALDAALAVGACCVEAADALSGIRSWDETLERIRAGWARKAQSGDQMA
jgi:sugar/nucleoside kinase (ribokinase family)